MGNRGERTCTTWPFRLLATTEVLFLPHIRPPLRMNLLHCHHQQVHRGNTPKNTRPCSPEFRLQHTFHNLSCTTQHNGHDGKRKTKSIKKIIRDRIHEQPGQLGNRGERTNFFASSINSWRLFVALSSGRWRMSSNKVGVPACAEAVAHVKAEASAPSPIVNFPYKAVLTANEGNFNDKYLTSSLTK